jgi:hypothetical protein
MGNLLPSFAPVAYKTFLAWPEALVITLRDNPVSHILKM